MARALQFHDYFHVVSRIEARSEKRDMYMLLDVNTEIYPMKENEKFLMALSPSLVLNTKVN